MSEVRFVYYLHDTASTDGRSAQIMANAETPVTIDDALEQKIGRPFHEVQLQCTLDTETGAVTIHGASA
jgi:hypothetical protein